MKRGSGKGKTILLIVILVIIFASCGSNKSKSTKEEQKEQNEEVTTSQETSVEGKVDSGEQAFEDWKNSKAVEEQSELEEKYDTVAETVNYEDVFYYDLMLNLESYNGQYVRTIIEVDYCSESNSGNYIRSKSTDYKEIDVSYCLKIYPDNYSNFEKGEFVIVEGRLAKENYDNALVNAHIVAVGDEAKSLYFEQKAVYDENARILAEQLEAEFKENASSPTYEDLMRYPDSYKDIQIKVNVKVIRVEPDGLIFDGDIEATMSGKSLALYDGRKTKEPKLLEGDVVTIYGYGKGLTTVKVKDVSRLIPKTVDSYSIPAIDIRYIEF